MIVQDTVRENNNLMANVKLLGDFNDPIGRLVPDFEYQCL